MAEFDKHIDSANWDAGLDSMPAFSEPYVEPFRLEWNARQRVRFFFMGVLQPVICFVYPLATLKPRGVWDLVDELFAFDDLWTAMLFFAVAIAGVLAIAISSMCLAACCIAPGNTRHRWIRRGLDAGLCVWLLILIGILGLTMFLVLIPALFVGCLLFAATHWLGNVFAGKYQFSIGLIMKLTFWVALATFFAVTIPAEVWADGFSLHGLLFAICSATPPMACYAFIRAVTDAN